LLHLEQTLKKFN